MFDNSRVVSIYRKKDLEAITGTLKYLNKWEYGTAMQRITMNSG